jgi:paraquat-inducible protein A
MPLALAVATLLLFLPTIIAPLMVVSSYGARRESWLFSSASALWHDGFPSLALVVCLFSIALPCLYLALLIWVLGSLQYQRSHPVGRSDPYFVKDRTLGTAFRWAKYLRPWVMIEVYLVGGFVAYSRIGVVATADVEVGGWCLLATSLLLLVTLIELDERTVWEMLKPLPAAAGPGTVGCTVCDLIVPADPHHRRCPRCNAALHPRKPRSIERTAALVAAGYILYIPANALPVLTTVRFGREEHNTIISGVLELISNDLWPLAVIVFVASIVLPLLKLFGLTWMLLATEHRSSRFLVGRTRLYRAIDSVGRWSNIDVFAVSVLVALLQFGALTGVHAGNGLIAFAAVVILTMIATTVFDIRLMWDAPRSGYG